MTDYLDPSLLPSRLIDAANKAVRIGPRTQRCFEVAFAACTEDESPAREPLIAIRHQIDGQLLRQTKGRVCELLLAELLILELKSPQTDASEAFLSGMFSAGGRLVMDQFLGHIETRGGIHTLVIDKVFEVKSFRRVRVARVRRQLEAQLQRIRDADSFLSIDTYPTEVRLAEQLERVSVAPSDVQSVDRRLDFTSDEVSRATEEAVSRALKALYGEERLACLFRSLLSESLLSSSATPRFRRVLCGR